MGITTTEPLHERLRSGHTKPGDDRRLAKALGIPDADDGSLELCGRAIGGSVDAALQLWRHCLPGQSLRIQVSHTPSALKMCAHLLKQVEER
jgi:hypothetical protein